MAAVVADTHAAVWYMADDPKLSAKAAAIMDGCTASGDPIFIPSISLVDLTYLVEKGRIPVEARQRFVDVLALRNGPFELASLDGPVANAVQSIDRDEVPDLPDRVIAATAVARGLALISRDRKIRASAVLTIW